MSLHHLNITVFGRVQGVYYRRTAKLVADQLGIKGIVMNKSDGTVYIEAEADHFSIENFLEWCHAGPEKARVDHVERVEGAPKNYPSFEIVKSLNPLVILTLK